MPLFFIFFPTTSYYVTIHSLVDINLSLCVTANTIDYIIIEEVIVVYVKMQPIKASNTGVLLFTWKDKAKMWSWLYYFIIYILVCDPKRIAFLVLCYDSLQWHHYTCYLSLLVLFVYKQTYVALLLANKQKLGLVLLDMQQVNDAGN